MRAERDSVMAILRKPPTQERSRQTVEVILKAAAQVLEKRGESALTTTSVAERAGVSIGTLYQYFSDRDAILLALASQEHDRMVDRMTRLFQAIDTASSVDPQRQFVRAVIASYARRRGATRLAALMARLKTPGGEPLRDEFIDGVSKFWSRKDGGQRVLTNKAHAYVMVRAIILVAQTTALENQTLLNDPDFEDALCLIVEAFGRRTEKEAASVARKAEKILA
jgi:AcrR family transcriptional regulator